MNVTLTSLEALILKATHETLPCPDSAALEAFCAIMKDSADGPQFAAQALAARIHSSNPKEALLALTMLDRCMRRCDANFSAEVGKFRFLNELIKLVSPKYLANRTALEVRTRIVQLLHAWSIEFPKESKFKVAYDMLKNQGVVKETPAPIPPEDAVPLRNKVKNAIFEDEEKSKLLQKLLQSKKPEDLQHANRLIKTMVKEEERRNEASSRRAQEVGAALDSAGLLRDMLGHAEDASLDELQLIHELHARCMRLRPVLQSLAASDNQAENLSDILHANDILEDVFEKYNAFVHETREKFKQPLPGRQKNVTNSESLLDFVTANVNKGNSDGSIKQNNTNNTLDELGDIFASETAANNIAEPLKPVNLMASEDIDLLGQKSVKVEGWNELDSLGEQLLKQSLPDNAKHVDSFNSKVKKIPMNALSSPKHEAAPANNGPIFDLDFFTKPEKPQEELKKNTTKPILTNDDVMVDISTPNTSNSIINNNQNVDILNLGLDDDNTKETNKDNEVKKDELKVKPLTDINVTIQSVHPSKVPPLKVFEEEDGVTVTLHFCKDKPRADVNVIVISTTSKNSSPIEDYKFQSVVPKGCKVRLLTPSGTSLPAFNPFLPPPALTQVMLIARPPTWDKVNLKFVITYTCNEDMCSEMGEVKDLPVNDI